MATLMMVTCAILQWQVYKKVGNLLSSVLRTTPANLLFSLSSQSPCEYYALESCDIGTGVAPILVRTQVRLERDAISPGHALTFLSLFRFLSSVCLLWEKSLSTRRECGPVARLSV